MARPKLTELNRLPDALSVDTHVMRIGTILGLPDTRNLSLKCFRFKLPGSTYTRIQVQLFGHAKNFSGKKTPSSEITVTFQEDVTMGTWGHFNRWLKIARSSDTGNRVSSVRGIAGYSTNLILEMNDTTGKTILELSLNNAFPTAVGEVDLDTNTPTPLTFEVTFSYDHMSVNKYGSMFNQALKEPGSSMLSKILGGLNLNTGDQFLDKTIKTAIGLFT